MLIAFLDVHTREKYYISFMNTMYFNVSNNTPPNTRMCSYMAWRVHSSKVEYTEWVRILTMFTIEIHNFFFLYYFFHHRPSYNTKHHDSQYEKSHIIPYFINHHIPHHSLLTNAYHTTLYKSHNSLYFHFWINNGFETFFFIDSIMHTLIFDIK